MPAGRPPKYGTGEDLIKLGEEMLQWLKENEKNDDIVHMCQFYIDRGIFRSEWRAIRQRPEFLPYYEAAMDIMASKTMRNTKLQSSYGNRYLAIYCKDVREHEKEIKKEEIELKRAELATVTEQAIEMNRKVVESISELQNQRKTLRDQSSD